MRTSIAAAKPSRVATAIRRVPGLIIVAWLAAMVAVSVVVPSLEKVGQENLVSLSSPDAPSYQAIKKLGAEFDQFDYDSMVMVLLESDTVLGNEAREYYRGLTDQLRADQEHVDHVQDFWGDRVTAGGSQSVDGKAAYVLLNLVGDQGTTPAKKSVLSVRDIVDRSNPPAGLKVYVTGPAALTMDLNAAADDSQLKMTLITFAIIALILLIIYRSIATMLLITITVFIELSAARGVVAILGHYQVMGLSNLAVNLLTMLGIAAATDYAIFFLGRYHEARSAGLDRLAAYYTTFRSVSHVVLGSGLTIAGATFCLAFTRLPYFAAVGLPTAVAMVVVVAAALTLTPAVLLAGTRFGLLESKRKIKIRGWRRIGSALVRWPKPILVVTMIVSIIGLGVLPSYTVNYNDRYYIPEGLPSIQGYQASDRHFSKAKLDPDILLIVADRDLRTPANMLVLERIARNVLRVEGINKVQSITRPLGAPIDHSSIPFQVSMQSVSMTENLQYMKDRMSDMLKMTDELGAMITIMERMHGLMQQQADITHDMVGDAKDLEATADEMRDHMANFDDFWRPLRNYLYWEPHCANIPICFSMRSLFDGLDGIDQLSENMDSMLVNLEKMDALVPQLVAQLPPMIAIAKSIRSTTLTMHTSFNGLVDQISRMTDTATVMGQAFDAAKNDDFFYLPPEAFDNEDFQKGLKLLVSPDGRSAQMIITHEGDPAGTKALATTPAELTAAEEAIKNTPLEGSEIYLGGTAATFHDIEEFVRYDLMIVVIAALSLILIIMLVMTRSIVAASVIVGTIAISLGSSFGLSVLIWQHILGQQLHWFVLPITVIILLAVGSDYNLLLVLRFKEELQAGLKTSIIRGVASSGSVATQAGLVFAITMGSMITNDLIAIGQVGSAICLGLLFDTFVIRAFMTPTVAALLGRWFWWPKNILPRSVVNRRAAGTDDSPGEIPVPVR
ncbi:putative membrane protein, MmpL [Mycolicibacterium litorale]|uniref:Putative membrane protein, MmpL n=1 Tax=Mycolicibacterium litorale TaxID=758802 RepID=A0A6S6P3A0_9MYCO|nr:RND family transporter [Mycolicibacterium litorale]BCI51130.1 putative membrane protein, MmpL [Mycolicibacterium litorale]